jgi:uncharacterized coiled-coil protein SlyX
LQEVHGQIDELKDHLMDEVRTTLVSEFNVQLEEKFRAQSEILDVKLDEQINTLSDHLKQDLNISLQNQADTLSTRINAGLETLTSRIETNSNAITTLTENLNRMQIQHCDDISRLADCITEVNDRSARDASNLVREMHDFADTLTTQTLEAHSLLESRISNTEVNIGEISHNVNSICEFQNELVKHMANGTTACQERYAEFRCQSIHFNRRLVELEDSSNNVQTLNRNVRELNSNVASQQADIDNVKVRLGNLQSDVNSALADINNSIRVNRVSDNETQVKRPFSQYESETSYSAGSAKNGSGRQRLTPPQEMLNVNSDKKHCSGSTGSSRHQCSRPHHHSKRYKRFRHNVSHSSTETLSDSDSYRAHTRERKTPMKQLKLNDVKNFIHFSGTLDDVTAQAFLCKFREDAEFSNIPESQYLDILGQVLLPPAIQWFRQIRPSIRNFKEFERLFLSQYHSPTVIASKRNACRNRRFNPATDKSVYTFAVAQFQALRELSGDVPDSYILDEITHMLPYKFQNQFAAHPETEFTAYMSTIQRLEAFQNSTSKTPIPAKNQNYQPGNKNKGQNFQVNRAAVNNSNTSNGKGPRNSKKRRRGPNKNSNRRNDNQHWRENTDNNTRSPRQNQRRGGRNNGHTGRQDNGNSQNYSQSRERSNSGTRGTYQSRNRSPESRVASDNQLYTESKN